MVKFQKQMERQLVAEWREVYCNYKQLKQQVKVIKEDRIKQHLQIATGSGGLQAGRDQHPSQLQKADSVGVPPSWSFANFARHIRVRGENLVVVHNKRIEACGVDEELYETELLGPFSGAQHEKDFFARLDAQLNQVNRFYKHKEEEYIFQSRQLVNQVDSLVEMKKASSTENSETGPSIHENQKRYIKDMKGDYRKCALDGLALCKHRRKLAEKMLQVAFLEFYRGLELLKGYSSLNLMAFAKILKKYDKVTGQETADTYLRAVRTSYFTSSNQIMDLMDTVEELFTEHFALGDRKLALTFLQPRSRETNLNFALGLFTGCSWSLLVAFGLMLIVSKSYGIFGGPSYIMSVFPAFSTILLFVLHMHVYGLNIYLWRRMRINYAFIFEFAPGTELRFQDMLLISTGLATLLIAGTIMHLSLYTLGYTIHILRKLVPVAIFFTLCGVLFLPVDMCYRSTRIMCLRSIWRILSSPVHKVIFADFFLADQLTSQVTALRNIAYIFCYYGGTYFNASYDITECTNSSLFISAQYFLALLPYWWRLMQCVRKWLDESDNSQIANGGKYLSAMVAVMMRLSYARFNSRSWLALFISFSMVATVYQLYWDIVMDWGLLQFRSSNPWLRDQLILKRKFIYFISMTVNVVLRLCWLVSVTHLQHRGLNHGTVDFLLAFLEILRRGHWNFYRVENEHLNNVGRLRAVRSLLLPLKDMEAIEAS